MAKHPAQTAARRQSLPKAHRLLQAKQFQHVFDNVDCKISGRYFTFLTRSNSVAQAHNRLGLAISKRNVPLAITRNRIKRIAREVFRTQATSASLPPFDVIVLAKAGARSLSREQLHQELTKQWKTLIAKRSKLPKAG